jgi:hypothetical protein
VAAVDITSPQTWNRYAYVMNTPLNSTDPLGLYIVGCEDTGDSNCDDNSGGFDCGIGICPIIPIIPCCFGGPPPPKQPPPGNPPPSQPPSAPQPLNSGNETLGLPSNLQHPWGIWSALIPTGNCGDISCPPIGDGFLAGVSGNGTAESPWTFYVVVLASALQPNPLAGFEALDPLSYPWGRRILVSGALINVGGVVAGASGIAQFGLCATSGPICLVTVPATGPTFLGGLGLTGEGIYYLFRGRFYVP